jgi:hypothetical protein
VKRVDDGLLIHDVCEGIGIWSLCAADLIKYWQVIVRPWEISTETWEVGADAIGFWQGEEAGSEWHVD